MNPAAIKFTQGALTAAAGVAVTGGVTGTPVVTSNGDNTDVASWTHELLDAPPGSALALGTYSTTATGAFTPDVDGGCYRVRLTTRDGSGNVSVDIRNFGVPDALGACMPSFQPAPGVDYSKDEFNFGNQLRSWVHLVETSFAALKAATGGAGSRLMLTLVDGAIATTLTSKADTLVTFSGLTANRAIALPASPATGQIVKFKNKDGDTSLSTHTLTISGNGNNVANGASFVMGNGTLYGAGFCAEFQFNGTDWELT